MAALSVRTDHQSLKWLQSFKEPEGQVARWLEALAEYDMTIVHRPGRQHCNADGLSRMECTQCRFHFEEQEPLEQLLLVTPEESWLPVGMKRSYGNISNRTLI